MGVGERRSSARVLRLGSCYVRGSQEERSPVNGVCAGTGTISVRSLATVGPERVKTTVPLPLFCSYAAAVLQRPVRCPRSNRIVGNAKQATDSTVTPKR